jgi:hypothetical protein
MFLSLPPQAALKMALRGCGFPGEMNKKKSLILLVVCIRYEIPPQKESRN